MLENKNITHRYRTKNAFKFQMVKVVEIIGILVEKVGMVWFLQVKELIKKPPLEMLLVTLMM